MGLVVVRKVVQCDQQSAYDQWLQVVWRQGGGLPPCEVLEPGDPTTGADCLRLVSGCIRERILETERPSKVVYTIVSGPFPIKDHRGEITFQAPTDGDGSAAGATVVQWRVQYSPTVWGIDWLLHAIMQGVFNWMLSTLAKEVKKGQRK